mgnify:CR=1 FL=1
MNFPTVPTIQEAIIERTNHPAFGYFNPTDEYFDSIIRWQAKRNGVQGLTKECIGYENGVLGGVISALNCVCSKGDKILIHSPTYIGFTMSLKNNGYEAVHSPLVKDENGVWRMDFEDMEKHLKEEKIHAAIMCNPHNPCGRVWERWELEKAMELYKKYDVYVVSDEIWSDIILSGNKHIPTQSVSEDARQRTAAFYAPSKTFNLAGLVGSYHIVYNSWWRDRMERVQPEPLQHDERPLHACPDRCLQARGLRVDRRALRGADRQHRLCLRLHREAFRGRDRLQAAGHLHAVRGLHRLVQGPRQDH